MEPRDALSSSLKGGLGQIFGQAGGETDGNSLSGLLSQILARTDLGSAGGLLAKLQEAGLGSLVSSWLGNGPNLSVTSDQLHAALGSDQVRQIAKAIGLPTEMILSVLSEHLPGAIDKMSPNGTLVEASGA